MIALSGRYAKKIIFELSLLNGKLMLGINTEIKVWLGNMDRSN